MKVVYCAQDAWEETYIKERLPGIDVLFTLGTLQEHGALADADADVLCVFVSSHVGATELDRFPKVKLIATRSTGFDHIDLAEAKKRGITVVTVPSYGINTVAEFAFALLLGLTRNVCTAYRQVREDASFSQEGLTGTDLAGKTMGLVGCGRIGVHTARIAKGFGMNVIVYDVFQNPQLAQEIGFEYVSLEALLPRADVISVHVPYNEQTHHLINLGNVGSIKKGAYFINTARGAIVETAALVKGLQDGTFAGIGLDVLEDEQKMGSAAQLQPSTDSAEAQIIIANRYLMSHPNVIVTPHIAFDTNEAIRRILDTTVANITAFASGTPTNTVS
jgi:D-lactate dehydrogenase